MDDGSQNFGAQPQPRFPNTRQPGILPEVWAALQRRGGCERFLRGECQQICQPLNSDGTYSVQVDHVIPRANPNGEAGSNDAGNLQVLCALKNQEKYNLPDSRYSGPLFFDSEINTGGLRPHQLMKAYRKVTVEYKEQFAYPGDTLKRIMVLAWFTGAGKTLGAYVLPFAINHIRIAELGSAVKRVKKVLHLVHQRSLVKSIASELRREPVEFGITVHTPKVQEVEDQSHWKYDANIVVACPQALWDTKNTMGTDKRKEILAQFDLIVIDEAQFGVDRYLEICELAPHAYKFAITATPMDSNGTFLSQTQSGKYHDFFVLFSVFDYEAGREQGIYKEILPLDEGEAEGVYLEEGGGRAVVRNSHGTTEEENTNAVSLERDMHIIKRGRELAIAQSHKSNYDSHVMVRVGSIKHAQSLLLQLQSELGDEVCAVYSGAKGPMLGDNKHPWMLSKANSGRIPEGGARIVLTIDIGQFGINQRYCGVIAWCAGSRDIKELVQRIGRAVRHHESMTPSKVGLVWNQAENWMRVQLAEAIYYIHNMEDMLLNAFKSMDDLDGLVPEVPVPEPARGVDPDDRTRVIRSIGRQIIEDRENGRDVDWEEGVIRAVNDYREHHPKASPQQIERIEEYAQQFKDKQSRDKVLSVREYEEAGIPFVVKEEPPKDYGEDRLIASIRSGVIYRDWDQEQKEELIEEIDRNSKVAIRQAAEQLRGQDERNRNIANLAYYPARLILGNGRLRDGEIEPPGPSYRFELSNRFGYKEETDSERRSAIGKAIGIGMSRTLNKVFGFSREEQYQLFESHFSDCLMRASTRLLIVTKAYYSIIEDNPELFAEEYAVLRCEESENAA
jgi:hypothetical protein